MCEKTIHIMIDSASRPDLLEQTLQSLQKHLKFDGKLIWLLHEAFLNPNRSAKCLEIARKFDLFNIVEISDPPEGQGNSINKVLKHVFSKYFIHWEDDMLAVREINLDIAWDILEKFLDVNQVIFNRRDTMPECSGFIKKVIKRGDYYLTTSPHWRYTPAVWRLSWITPKWLSMSRRALRIDSHWEINAIIQRKIGNNKDADWVIGNMGTYYLGPIDEKAYVKHIGFGRSGREN